MRAASWFGAPRNRRSHPRPARRAGRRPHPRRVTNPGRANFAGPVRTTRSLQSAAVELANGVPTTTEARLVAAEDAQAKYLHAQLDLKDAKAGRAAADLSVRPPDRLVPGRVVAGSTRGDARRPCHQDLATWLCLMQNTGAT
jgi:hypothetical protein